MKGSLKKKGMGSFNLFYIEMMIVLLFFMTASVVIINAFVTADRVSKESSALEYMSFCGQTAAESFSESGNAVEAVKTAFGADITGGFSVIPLNERCEYTVDGAYEAVISITEEEDLPVMEIRYNKKSGEQVYLLRCAGKKSKEAGNDF